MTLFYATLRALLPLFLLILLGYGLKKARVLHAAHVPVMNGIVLNVTLPALVIRGLASAPHLAARAALLPLASLGAEAVTVAAALGLGALLRLPMPTRGAMALIGAFGNTGFLGYPMTLALLPRQFPVAILIDQFGMTMAMYLGAVVVGSVFGPKGGEAKETKQAMLRFFRSPIFLSVMVGCAALLVPWPAALVAMPAARAAGGLLMQCLGYLGQGTTPLVLLALGVSLRPGTARAYGVPLGAACVLKLLVCPLAMWGICRAMGLHGDALRVGMLQMSMPTAVTASILCADHDLSADYAVGGVFAGTALAALTIPLLLSVLH